MLTGINIIGSINLVGMRRSEMDGKEITRRKEIYKLLYRSKNTIKNAIKKTILLTSSKHSRLNPTPTKISLSILQNPPPMESFNKSQMPIAVLLEGKFESVFKNRILPKQSINFKNKSKITQMIIVSDGDIARNNYKAKLGFSRSDIAKNNRRIFEYCSKEKRNSR